MTYKIFIVSPNLMLRKIPFYHYVVKMYPFFSIFTHSICIFHIFLKKPETPGHFFVWYIYTMLNINLHNLLIPYICIILFTSFYLLPYFTIFISFYYNNSIVSRAEIYFFLPFRKWMLTEIKRLSKIRQRVSWEC